MMKPCCERESLMQQVQSFGFAFDEAVLYLDTHPCDKVALAQVAEYNKRYHRAAALYREKCGPLTASDASECDKWKWIDCPWPWEVN